MEEKSLKVGAVELGIGGMIDFKEYYEQYFFLMLLILTITLIYVFPVPVSRLINLALVLLILGCFKLEWGGKSGGK